MKPYLLQMAYTAGIASVSSVAALTVNSLLTPKTPNLQDQARPNVAITHFPESREVKHMGSDDVAAFHFGDVQIYHPGIEVDPDKNPRAPIENLKLQERATGHCKADVLPPAFKDLTYAVFADQKPEENLTSFQCHIRNPAPETPGIIDLPFEQIEQI